MATMPTRPREWPDNAKTARDQAAAEIVAVTRRAQKMNEILQPLTQNGGVDLTREDQLRLFFLLNNHLTALTGHAQHALRWLESVGAPTKPPTVPSE